MLTVDSRIFGEKILFDMSTAGLLGLNFHLLYT